LDGSAGQKTHPGRSGRGRLVSLIKSTANGLIHRLWPNRHGVIKLEDSAAPSILLTAVFKVQDVTIQSAHGQVHDMFVSNTHWVNVIPLTDDTKL